MAEIARQFRHVIAIDGEALRAEHIDATIRQLDRLAVYPGETKAFLAVADTPADVSEALDAVGIACDGYDDDEVRQAVAAYMTQARSVVAGAGLTHIEGKPAGVWLGRHERRLGTLAYRMAKWGYDRFDLARFYRMGQHIGTVAVAGAFSKRGRAAMTINPTALFVAWPSYTSDVIDIAASTQRLELGEFPGLYERGVTMVTGGGFVSDAHGRAVDLGPRGTDYSAVALAAMTQTPTAILVREELGELGRYVGLSYEEAYQFTSPRQTALVHPFALEQAQASGIAVHVNRAASPYHGGAKIGQGSAG